MYWKKAAWFVIAMSAALSVPGTSVAIAQQASYSDWEPASGTTPMEYRWRTLNSRDCAIEYRLGTDGKKMGNGRAQYKSRILFRRGDEEQSAPVSVLSLVKTAPTATEEVVGCSMITDVLVTHY